MEAFFGNRAKSHSIFHSAIEEWKNVSCFSFRLIGLCIAKYHKSLGKINKEMDV